MNVSQIKLDDAMEDEELKFGPNGGLIFCMEYLMENMDWLERQLSGAVGEDGEVGSTRNSITPSKVGISNPE